ncbi:MAG TPA: hypothetical protein VG871_17485 [Vicinamibacterales bacterium]|nr:hypothetical protein [Vicinamibacterales bacterium]
MLATWALMPERPVSANRSSFAFVEAVCDAIERFTAVAVKNDRSAFWYRGANLRYAVERALYVRLVNDDRLCVSFCEGSNALLQLDDESFSRHRWFERAVVRHRLRAEYLRLKRSRGSSAVIDAGDHRSVIAHVIHEKFVRYLRPVMDKLPATHAYLAVLDESFPVKLEQEGVPYIDASQLELPPARVPLSLLQVSELTAWYDRIYHALSILRPRCVVLAEGNAPQDEVANRVCGVLGIPTVCVQHGWAHIVHTGFRHMTYSKMAVWGDGFADILRPFNPDQQFVSTGHPGLKTGACNADGQAIGFFLQAPGVLITRDAWRCFLTLIRQTADRLPDRRILVREHPARPLEPSERALLVAPNIQFVPPAIEDLGTVLRDVGVVVSIYSTTLLEGLASGAVPVVVNLTSSPSYFPDIAASGAGVEVRDTGDALDVITRLAASDQYRDQFVQPRCDFRSRFFEPGSSSDNRIVSLIATHTEH